MERGGRYQGRLPEGRDINICRVLGRKRKESTQVVVTQYAKVLGGRDMEELRQECLHDNGGAIEDQSILGLASHVALHLLALQRPDGMLNMAGI